MGTIVYAKQRNEFLVKQLERSLLRGELEVEEGIDARLSANYQVGNN